MATNRHVTQADLDEFPPRPEEDKSIFTDAQMIEIRAEAAKRVREEIEAAERERMMEKALREERIKAGILKIRPDEEIVTFACDLPPFSDAIRVDGKVFHHGYSYKVTRTQFDSLREIMWRSHRHQLEIDGKASDHYRHRQTRLSGRTGLVTGMPSSAMMATPQHI